MVDAKKMEKMIVKLQAVFAANFELLSELDAQIGDGDHGASMLRGFTAIKEQLPDKSFDDINTLMQQAGRILMKEIGGTCGPLFATFFMKGGYAIKDVASLDTHTYYLFAEAGAAGVAALGKTQAGDKTMYDAMIAAVTALNECDGDNLELKDAARIAAKAAMAGAEDTKNMEAKKGRGRYQGESSVGAMDAGAMSVALIFESFSEDMAAS